MTPDHYWYPWCLRYLPATCGHVATKQQHCLWCHKPNERGAGGLGVGLSDAPTIWLQVLQVSTETQLLTRPCHDSTTRWSEALWLLLSLSILPHIPLQCLWGEKLNTLSLENKEAFAKIEKGSSSHDISAKSHSIFGREPWEGLSVVGQEAAVMVSG